LTKDLKTKIAFISILSLIPNVILGELNYISATTGIIGAFLALFLTLSFGREYIRDMGDKTKMR